MIVNIVLSFLNKRANIIFLTFTLFFISKIFLTEIPRVDSGYFLSISRDLSYYGKFPYIHVNTAYTPVGYFIYSLVFLIFENPRIEYFYVFNMLIIFLSIYFIYRTLCIINVDYLKLYCVAFYLILSPLIFDIKLEMFVVLFNAILVFFILNYNGSKVGYWHFMFIAFILALLFFTKQYSLISILFSFTLMYYLRWSRILLEYLYIVFFFVLWVLIALIVFSTAGVDFKYLCLQLVGENIIECSSSYGQYSLINLLLSIKYFKIYPAFIGLIVLAFFKKTYYELFTALVLLIIGSLPYFFQLYPHYFYYGFVFVFVFSIPFLEKNSFLKSTLLLLFVLNVYSIYVFLINLDKNIAIKVETIQTCKKVNAVIPQRSEVFLVYHRELYFACNFQSINSKFISYNFYPLDIISCNLKLLKNKKFYVVTKSKISGSAIQSNKLFSFLNFEFKTHIRNEFLNKDYYIYKLVLN
jgi:hypothetical protein